LDHIIPHQQQNEVNTDLDDPRNYATACRMCNDFGNKTRFMIPKNISFDKQVASVFEQKKRVIMSRRAERYEYWSKNVKPKLTP
jgi:recombinational DNA repair protein RecR